MKTIRSLMAVLAASVVLTLAACGGGGGGGSPAPAPTPTPTPDTTPPVLTLSTSSPAALTTTVVVTANEPLGGNVSITVQMPNGPTVTGSTTLNQNNLGMTWTNLSGSPLACNTAYRVTASAADLAGNVGNLSATTLTTVACPAGTYWSPPPTAAPQGTKVFGANQLPSGCTSWQQQCWKDAVANGTVKWVASGGTSAGRPVVFAYFRNTNNVFGNGGLWNHLPFYADTGEPASQDINGGVGTEVEWLVGNAVGAILRSGGQCFEHYNAGSTWSNRSVTCP